MLTLLSSFLHVSQYKQRLLPYKKINGVTLYNRRQFLLRGSNLVHRGLIIWTQSISRIQQWTNYYISRPRKILVVLLLASHTVAITALMLPGI
jgi:hypothetical protein